MLWSCHIRTDTYLTLLKERAMRLLWKEPSIQLQREQHVWCHESEFLSPSRNSKKPGVACLEMRIGVIEDRDITRGQIMNGLCRTSKGTRIIFYLWQVSIWRIWAGKWHEVLWGENKSEGRNWEQGDPVREPVSIIQFHFFERSVQNVPWWVQ